MTLLELLVKELSGAWPVDAHGVVQDSTGQIWFFKNGIPYYTGSFWGADKEQKDFDWVQWDLRLDLAVDNNFSIVTREQYEEALAESQEPVWDGEGLPPIGCDIEFTLDTDKYSVQGIIPENGQVVNVVAHKQTTDGNPVAVVYWDERGAGRAAAFIKAAFSPLRTEADRNREEAIDALLSLGTSLRSATASIIYDAIAAGKIPGVELSK